MYMYVNVKPVVTTVASTDLHVHVHAMGGGYYSSGATTVDLEIFM